MQAVERIDNELYLWVVNQRRNSISGTILFKPSSYVLTFEIKDDMLYVYSYPKKVMLERSTEDLEDLKDLRCILLGIYYEIIVDILNGLVEELANIIMDGVFDETSHQKTKTNVKPQLTSLTNRIHKGEIDT